MKTTIRNKTLLTLAAALLLAAHSVQAEDNTGNGGTITYTDSSGANPAATPWPGGYVVHTFTSSDTLTIPAPVSADVLVVAGGGGGGSFAGGGGAGGLIYSNGFAVSVGSTSVTIGAGGAGGGLNARGSAGSNSVFGALIAYGGGGGGARDGSSVRNGTSGGSGGGGSPADSAPQGMGGTNSPADQGFPGGNGANWGWGGGGGGGAGGIGTNATANYGGAGGVGVVNAIQTGTNQYYGGGGGGGTYSGSAAGVTAGSGGLGGGGAGSRTANGTDGAPNTGGGGGGSEYQKIGGNGGSGIVIVRYPYDPGTFSIALASPANGQSLSSTASVSATASVFSATPPCTVNFYLDSNPVSTTNNAPTTVTVDLGVLALGSHTLYATATDSTFTTVSSGTHTFTVETDTTAPAPNPMTFAIAPGPAGADSVVMTATTATDAWTPPVEYSFENTTNSSNSGWISSTVWTDTGLSPVTVYGYRVKARDAVGNETDWSGEAVTMTPGWPTTNLYWDGGTAHIAGNGNGASQGGSGTWDTTIQNWDLGADYPHVAWYNPNNDTAVFGGTAGTITLGTDITVGGLTFTTADTLTGGTVTFGTPGTISNSTDVTIASVLAGTQPITKSGAGTLSLTGSNTFSGDLVINGGTMANATAAGFGTGTNLTFAGSGTVLPAYSAGGHVLAKSVAVNSGVTATLNVPNQYYHLTFTGAVTGSGSLSVISSDNGAGSVTLPNSANTFTGTLQVGNADYGTTLTVNSLADSVNPIKMYGTTNSSRTANFNLGGGTAAPLLFDSRQIELLGSTGASAFISNNNATPTNTIT
ncbi:MAG: autotransporter-associated beta strand repeat-containing protein, partial [Verrucomicrobia bacterium]|nr:autotransporter-associated beta strand repeat-containing protein [Verrucomicrobiota bacterium]